MKKRFLSCFMALALCLSLMPTAALAAEDTTEPSTQLTEPTPVPEEPEEPETPDQPEETKTPVGGPSPGRGTLCGRGVRPGRGDVICGCDDGGGAYALPVRR